MDAKEKYEQSLAFWQKELDDKGADYLRSQLPHYHGDHRLAGYEIVSKHERIQSDNRHSDLIGQGREMLELQRTGNRIQWGVLGVLVVTVLVTIATCTVSQDA